MSATAADGPFNGATGTAIAVQPLDAIVTGTIAFGQAPGMRATQMRVIRGARITTFKDATETGTIAPPIGVIAMATSAGAFQDSIGSDEAEGNPGTRILAS